MKVSTPKGWHDLVRVKSSGACHSDNHLWERGYEDVEGQFLKRVDRGVKYPLIIGHGISGKVDISGDEAEVDLVARLSKCDMLELVNIKSIMCYDKLVHSHYQE